MPVGFSLLSLTILNSTIVASTSFGVLIISRTSVIKVCSFDLFLSVSDFLSFSIFLFSLLFFSKVFSDMESVFLPSLDLVLLALIPVFISTSFFVFSISFSLCLELSVKLFLASELIFLSV